MRVVVASDAQAGLTGAAASEAIAGAFAAAGATVAVVPLATAGNELRSALAAASADAQPVSIASIEELTARAPGAALLDLTAASAPGLAQLLAVDQPIGEGVVALVAEDQVALPLTGLNGVAATLGRTTGAALPDVLAYEARIERWADSLGMADAPGAGALGGLGALVLAGGGRVVDPLTFLAERFGLSDTLRRADLAVTGAEALDFHGVGGPIVKRVVALAAEALCPTLAIVGENYVSARELRLAGLEAAYPWRDAGRAGANALAEVAARVAATWVR